MQPPLYAPLASAAPYDVQPYDVQPYDVQPPASGGGRACPCAGSCGLNWIMLVSIACLAPGVLLHSAGAVLAGVLVAFVAALLCLPGSSALLFAGVLCLAWVVFAGTVYHSITHIRLHPNATAYHIHVHRR